MEVGDLRDSYVMLREKPHGLSLAYVIMRNPIEDVEATLSPKHTHTHLAFVALYYLCNTHAALIEK